VTKHLRIIPELAETAVAVEAQYCADIPSPVIVIDVSRLKGQLAVADRAEPPLVAKHLQDVLRPDPVPPLQVIVPGVPVVSRDALGDLRVLAGPAIGADARWLASIADESIEGDDLRAPRAVLHAFRDNQMTSFVSAQDATLGYCFPVLCIGVSLAEAGHAIQRQSVRRRSSPPEL
jgi:hypothetical protein